MSSPNLTDCISDTESCEDEIEPKLKYMRLTNDLKNILLTSSATCIAVHPKFICIGSHWGVIHILDHQGNSIAVEKLKKHTVSVNHISIDTNGEFIATCSDDGKVFIQGLFSKDNNADLNVGRLVKTVALDPSYYKSGFNRRFITVKSLNKMFVKPLLTTVKSRIEDYPELEFNGNIVHCTFCKKDLTWERKTNILRHVNTKTHKADEVHGQFNI